MLSSFAQSYSDFETNADSFFKNYVNNGGVNYLALKTNPKPINNLIGSVAKMDLNELGTNEKKAFLINAYNLIVIHQVVQNYPTKSVMDVAGFFKETQYTVAGKKASLNDIENSMIRPVYKDARVHFVLVCGAVSCPPIINSAYKASTLDKQLNEQTRKAMNNPDFIQVNDTKKEVNISEIFNWYKSDFVGEHKNVLEYINAYRSKAIPAEYKQGSYTYNWQLNENNEDKGELSPVVKTPFDEEAAEEPKKKSINLQDYTPSVLLSKGQWEFKSFQNLYTQKGGYGPNNQYVDYGNRSTFFTSINQFTYGINRRFNVGVDAWVKSVLYDNKEDSPLEIFEFKSTPQSRTTLSTIGPRIRVNPIKEWEHFAINTSFLIPIGSDQNASESSSDPWLAQDAYLWISQIYYDQKFGKKFQMFFQLQPWFTIQKPGEADANKFEVPFDIFASYFATKRLSFYLQQELWSTFDVEGELASYFLQGGLGVKYQVLPGLFEVEGSYTNFYYGMNAGAGQTFNIGIRLLGGGK